MTSRATAKSAAPVIGTAGWSVPADFGDGESQLQRYAGALGGVEINSSFYRSHRLQTYERWAASTPAGFRFAVKVPKHITHELKLQDADAPLARFLSEASGLGGKWAVALVQLPPSLALDDAVAGAFFERLRAGFGGAVVCEPRHASWFTPEAEALLREWRVSRGAADPARMALAAAPGGWLHQVRYYRWHGSPRVYWSEYGDDWLRNRAAELRENLSNSASCWCIFDNTAAGCALPNALRLRELLDPVNAA